MMVFAVHCRETVFLKRMSMLHGYLLGLLLRFVILGFLQMYIDILFNILILFKGA